MDTAEAARALAAALVPPSPPPPPQQDVPLPPGASHWDKLPLELRDLVKSHTTPTLSWYLRCGLLRAEVRSTLGRFHDRLWAEVFESDWQGDLSSLPHLLTTSPVPLSIVSRGMPERLRKARKGLKPHIEQRLCVRRGWTDLLDFGKPDVVADVSAREGDVRILGVMFDSGLLGTASVWVATTAARAGQLETVKWLHGGTAGAEWPTAVMDGAAGSGNLDLVVWLHENVPAGCTAHAMASAAQWGHLHIAEWLTANRKEGCRTDAFRYAGDGGHAEILELLRVRFPGVFLQADESVFAGACDLSVLKWLKEHRPHALCKRQLPNTVASGNVEAVSWLVSTTEARIGQSLLLTAIEMNHKALVRWMVVHKGVRITADMFDSYKHGYNTDALAWIIQHDWRWAGIMADKFAESGDVTLIEWLHVRYPGSVTQSTLESAIRANDIMAEHLLKDFRGIEWDLERAKHVAIEEELDNIQSLIENLAANAPSITTA